MKFFTLLALGGVLAQSTAAAPPPPPLQPIGALASFSRTAAGLTVVCTDRSEIQLGVLAPDLVRVRAAFGQPLPAVDHSWAIERTAWEVVPWTLAEQPDGLHLATAELEIVIRRDPLLIEFRDAGTHRLINADQRPMAFDPAGGTVAAAKRLGWDEHFYGLGEKAARLDKRRGEFSMWNSDTPGYVEGTDPIYQSIPFYLGWEAGAADGIFFDNSYRTHFDFGSSNQEAIEFSAEGGEMNYYFFRGPGMKKILARYADLTGHMSLPPLWALGHQQSRYSYYPDTLAEAIVDRYRADDLPLDVLHLDIHYMNGYRDFTWDPRRFPDPKGFTDRLRAKGVKVVTIVDPGVKFQPPAPGATDPTEHPELAPQDQSYYAFNQGKAGDFFLKRKNGEPYIGRVWPGDSVFVDYTLPAAARWWGGMLRAYTDQGVAGIWTDMNEPADFIDRLGKSQGDVLFDDGGTHSPYAKNRNVFALGMARATYEGLARLRPNERPFVITRAGYAGIQRYSTMWTGDNNCSWESLALTIPMFATLGLSGQPFVGADIPGFRGTADGELLARWYEAGFLAPLCRNHAENRSYDHEPWRFGTYYEDIVRKYLKLRYRLLPFLYTTLEEAHRTGVPLFRPLLLNYQDDPNTLALDDEFMIGSDLLVAPVLHPSVTSRLVYLPRGAWYDFWTSARLAGGTTVTANAPLDVVPLFVRAGSIIPSGPEMNFVDEKPGAPLRF
ncbi:MAG: Alpha-glucosidase, partial [Lacunisphaera sp.]|nr:Alpha-glucosidase [Lacunisphaera sp.]